MPIAPESGGQYSADHIQWYPPKAHPPPPQLASQSSSWARPN